MAGDVWTRLVTGWWRYTVSVVGVTLAAVAVVSILLDARVTRTELLQIASLLVLSGLLVVAGWRIARDLDETSEVAIVLGWMSAGVIALALLGVWFQLVSRTAETAFQSALIFLSPLAAGTLFGAIVGYYDVRVRRLVERASRESARREFVAEQRESLSTLNAILRHQVLNDLSAITGQAELLRMGKRDGEDTGEAILETTQDMVETVHRLETVANVIGGADDPGTIEIDDAVRVAIEDLREDHADVTVEYESDGTTMVVGDHLLSLALGEVLDNAARFSGESPTIRITITADDPVRIRVSDDGPGLSISPADRAFEPSERGVESDSDGLGLFLAATILERYGGEVVYVDPDTHGAAGAAFDLRVPAA